MPKSMKIYTEYYFDKFETHIFIDHGLVIVQLGDTHDWMEKKSTDFTRIEFLIGAKVGSGEVDNVSQDDTLKMIVAAYTWHDELAKKSDILSMYDFMDEIESVVKEISADRAAGNPPSTDFLKLESYSNIMMEPSFLDNISCGIMSYDITLTKELY